MCRRVTCSQCGKPTFAGCGAHIEQVLGNVPPAQRCKCDELPARPATTSSAAADWLAAKKEGAKS
jgi:hypothetical protein